VRSSIIRGSYKFEPADIWDLVSGEAKAFIKALLVIDPKKRLSAKECQQSTWLQDWAEKDRSQDNILSPNVVKALVNFKEMGDMRKLLCEVLSFTLLPEQIIDLRKEFEKLDTEGTGEISLSGLKEVLLQGAGSGSLGAFTENEIEDIFNAIRKRTSDSTRIYWHEFLAAGISQCEIDGRNLRLAFDRLDSDHKGKSQSHDIQETLFGPCSNGHPTIFQHRLYYF
jgi:calcium-dependent protein kinase